MKNSAKRIIDFRVGKSELSNSVTIQLGGQEFVMGRAVALSLAKSLQDVVNDWAFRYVSGTEVGEVT